MYEVKAGRCIRKSSKKGDKPVTVRLVIDGPGNRIGSGFRARNRDKLVRITTRAIGSGMRSVTIKGKLTDYRNTLCRLPLITVIR